LSSFVVIWVARYEYSGKMSKNGYRASKSQAHQYRSSRGNTASPQLILNKALSRPKDSKASAPEAARIWVAVSRAASHTTLIPLRARSQQ